MERYVIVCLIKDEALEFHEKLVADVCTRFMVKRQRLPAHFTIKAPFETDKIKEIEKLTEDFCIQHSKSNITLRDYGHFRESVVYMNVQPSKESIKIHDQYIDKLSEIKWLQWKGNEGKGRIFHCTVVSKLFKDKFKEVRDYVNKFPFCFEQYFDNITILCWERDRWVTYKEFTFRT